MNAWDIFAGAEIVRDDIIPYNRLDVVHDIGNYYMLPILEVRCELLEGRKYE